MMQDIQIGTLINAGNIKKLVPNLLAHGFETFSITFWETIGEVDLKETADEMKAALAGTGARVSSLSIFGNPLDGGERGDKTRKAWAALIDAAALFNTDLITGFAGRIVDRPVPESIPRFKEVFTALTQQAAAKNIRLAIENCDMGGDWEKGDWNIGFSPKAWEMMFEAVPADNLGLQWEPCHQMVQLVDPIPQLRKWVKKVFNLHGKDATVAWDIIKEKGIRTGEEYCWHRTPGFGDTNWRDIITILRMNGYKGSIDIEGFHDPVYKGDLEYTGQVHGLNYLKFCRGGDYVSDPN
jgi:sugar phosphate isomerase/epimerase